jgi:hypothetical protein
MVVFILECLLLRKDKGLIVPPIAYFPHFICELVCAGPAWSGTLLPRKIRPPYFCGIPATRLIIVVVFMFECLLLGDYAKTKV